ncbi:MAG: carboxypeptidase M32, partial [Lentisphaerae bacterium]|nr:carboxypeptidase M32 [Lentisphaerota bacterium]
MDTLTAYKEHLKEMNIISSALSLLSWDQETHMPPRGIAARAQVTGRFAKNLFELSVAPELGKHIETLARESSLTVEERASVRDIDKDYRRQKAIPPALIEEHATARSQAQAAWAEARKGSDFGVFQPLLVKMVDYARRFADYYGYEEHPYDALLEDFEPGMTVEKLNTIIEPLREQLVPFLQRLAAEGTPPDTTPIEGSFDVDKQRELARVALQLIGYDFDAGTLDDVAHPFTTTIAFDDVRVTNRYLEDHVTSGLFGALHEGGHALYNQGMPENLYHLRLNGGSSNGIHESQSRMVENLLGRSLPFWQHFQPILAEIFPQSGDISPEALYRAVNVVTPSFIRVEADEVTYNLHIMLRAELEAGLIAGEIQVADLPKRWNEAMDRYLGVTPPNDALGVLQDVHWSLGYFGYFPSYMLGNLYASQMATKIRRDMPDLDERIAAGDIAALIQWLKER